MLSSSDNPELRSGLDQLHEGRQLLVRDCDGVHLEELNETSAVTGFLEVEVSVVREQLSNIFSREAGQESFLKAEIDGSGEGRSVALLLLDPRRVLGGIEIVKAFRAESFQHHLVNVLQRIGALQVHLIVLFVLSLSGLDLHVGHLVLQALLLGILSSRLHLVHLLLLQYHGERVSSHVGIVSSFVIMRQKVLAFIVVKTIFLVIRELEHTFVAFVCGAFFVNNPKSSFVEVLGLVSKHFSVVRIGEFSVPVSDEFSVSVRQLANELVIGVDPVVHAVVPNEGFFSINHGFHHQ